ncbi:MAG TPA: hypothetical protein DCR97_00510 [Deltaproteobacteria bacterium]|nr:hypothetical protein [Deltaproteobacteria bacterium]
MTVKKLQIGCCLFLGAAAIAAVALPIPLHAQVGKERLAKPAMQAPAVSSPVTRQDRVAVQREIFLRNIKIESVRVWPESECKGSWEAMIRNPGDTALGNAIAIPYQLESNGNWTQGTPVNFFLDKQQLVAVTGQWNKLMYSTKFKVAFRPADSSQTYGDKEIDFVLDPNRNLSVVGIETTNEYVGVTVRNHSPQAVCELVVQKALAKSSDPNNWTPAGGKTVKLLGNSTDMAKFFINGTQWKQGWDLVKVRLQGPPGSGILYAERILPLQ